MFFCCCSSWSLLILLTVILCQHQGTQIRPFNHCLLFMHQMISGIFRFLISIQFMLVYWPRLDRSVVIVIIGIRIKLHFSAALTVRGPTNSTVNQFNNTVNQFNHFCKLRFRITPLFYNIFT